MKRLNGIIRKIFVNFDTRLQLGIIAFFVGVSSGLAAILLNYGLKKLSFLFHSAKSSLLLILIPALGIFLTVVILKYIIKDFGGHGIPNVIHSISIDGGKLKLRSSFSKLIGGLITISTGNSAGPEAPVVVSGAAIGSNIARYFKSNEMIKIAVTGSGAAAAIAAIFNAPLTGFIFTMEIIIGEWTTPYMLPVAISSVTGTIVSRMFNGNQIPFAHRLYDVGINDIIASIGLAIVISMFSLLFIKSLKNISTIMEKYLKNSMVKGVIGGLVVGLISFQIIEVRGEGYELIKKIISDNYSTSILFLLLIIILKIIATSLTLGSGGTGGVFAPALLIGSAGGFLYYLILQSLLPNVNFGPASLFALVGMGGMVSGTLAAPLTGIFLIVEITSGYDAILPLLLVSFLSSLIVKLFEKHSIYHYELIKQGVFLRPRTDGRILSDIKPSELLETDQIKITPNMLLKDLVPIIKKSKRNYFPVISTKDEQFLGIVNFNDVKEFIFEPNLLSSIIIEEIMQTDFITLSLDENLIQIQKKFDKSKSWSLPVVKNGKFLGLISKATMLDLYRKELKAQTEQ